MQRCGKDISTAVNQHATIEEAVFSVGAVPRQLREVGSWSKELREMAVEDD
jgi:predicted hydrocarbon binding protein